MTEFERGIGRAIAIYQAGIKGQPLPKLLNVHISDARAIYSCGVMDAAEELDKVQDVQRAVTRFLTRYQLTDSGR